MRGKDKHPKIFRMKPCDTCWETFKPRGPSQRFCSRQCGDKYHNQKRKKRVEEAIIEGESETYLKIRFMILRRDGFKCQYCGRSAKQEAILHIDHIVPRSKGGAFTFDNLITSCLECNLGKRDVLLTKREINRLQGPPTCIAPVVQSGSK